MRIIIRVIFIFLILAVTVTTGFFIGTSFNRNQPVNPGFNHQLFHKILQLTPDQLNRLVPIEKKFSRQKIFYNLQIRLANRELGDIMKQEKAYTPKVQAAVQKVHNIMGQLQEVTLIHFFDMRAILDENQARILDNYVADALDGP